MASFSLNKAYNSFVTISDLTRTRIKSVYCGKSWRVLSDDAVLSVLVLSCLADEEQ